MISRSVSLQIRDYEIEKDARNQIEADLRTRISSMEKTITAYELEKTINAAEINKKDQRLADLELVNKELLQENQRKEVIISSYIAALGGSDDATSKENELALELRTAQNLIKQLQER
jgi:hypothetical protein